MKGIILAGGYAKRLWPLTKEQPKHLLPVANRPMIEHLLERIFTLPIDHYYLVTNDKFASHFEQWLPQKWKDKITIVNDKTTTDEDRLGSLGDILYVVDNYSVDDDLFIIGADNITDFDFSKLYNIYVETKKPVVGAFDIKNLEDAKELGVIDIDDDDNLTGFVEKPDQPTSTLCSTLFYMLPKSAVDVIRVCVADGMADKAGWLITRLKGQEQIKIVVHKGYWFDIGSPDQYRKAQEFFS